MQCETLNLYQHINLNKHTNQTLNFTQTSIYCNVFNIDFFSTDLQQVLPDVPFLRTDFSSSIILFLLPIFFSFSQKLHKAMVRESLSRVIKRPILLMCRGLSVQGMCWKIKDICVLSFKTCEKLLGMESLWKLCASLNMMKATESCSTRVGVLVKAWKQYTVWVRGGQPAETISIRWMTIL